MSRVTIADVARAAEVSTATVSNALNGTGRLTASTRTRVRAVAASLGYGGPTASRTLALTVTTYGHRRWDFADVPFFAQAIAAATAAAHKRGYALTALPSAPDDSMWSALPVAGVLVLDSPGDDPVVRILRSRGLPLAFDGHPTEPRTGEVYVDNDHRATTHEVLDHFAAQGSDRVALIAGVADDHYTRTCVAAYREWCAGRGVPPRVLPMAVGDEDGHTYDTVLSGADRPNAIYGLYDPCGRRVLASAARCGLSVPADLLLVCASEDPSYATDTPTAPAVSTVSLDPRRTASTAVTALIDLIEHPQQEPASVTVPARLHIRASSLRERASASRT